MKKKLFEESSIGLMVCGEPVVPLGLFSLNKNTLNIVGSSYQKMVTQMVILLGFKGHQIVTVLIFRLNLKKARLRFWAIFEE
ncbi:hypothetical protein KKA09_04400 [Patescibacteria group bacterium]|nr:hypothetical protein [Patescibacteria group bacterium]MBU1679788.1 hypothetical protein [Bacteroidota bacterium]MBU2579324.1 hypothetical protein [Patescibacteria group bacterium]